MIWRAALLGAFAALLVLPSLGYRYIATGDEARFALLAQDMLDRGTWFDARLRDQRYRNKPLLYPWAIKVLALPGGRVTEAAAHLPVAGAAVASIVLVTVLGHQLFSAAAGVGAGLITATSYAFFQHSQILLPDMLVVAFDLAALCAFWAAVQDPAPRHAMVAFYVALALGLAAKGPMGLLPIPIVVVWLWTAEGARGLRRLVSRPGLLAFGVLTALWLVPYLGAGGGSYARSVVWGDWLAWYLGGPSPVQMLNMALTEAAGLVPWTALLALPLLAVRARWRDGAFRLAFLSWLIPLVVVLLSSNHRARYLLPTYPAAGLLIAGWGDRHGTQDTRAVRVVTWLSGAGVVVMLLVLGYRWTDPLEREVVSHFWWKAGAIAGGALLVQAYACWMLRRHRPRALVVGLALGMAVLLTFGFRVYAAAMNRQQDYPRLAALIERYAQGGEIAVTGGRFFSVDFYLGRAITQVRGVSSFDEWVGRPGRPLLLITGREWSLIRSKSRSNVEIVDSMRVSGHMMFLLRAVEPAAPPAPRRSLPGSSRP